MVLAKKERHFNIEILLAFYHEMDRLCGLRTDLIDEDLRSSDDIITYSDITGSSDESSDSDIELPELSQLIQQTPITSEQFEAELVSEGMMYPRIRELLPPPGSNFTVAPTFPSDLILEEYIYILRYAMFHLRYNAFRVEFHVRDPVHPPFNLNPMLRTLLLSYNNSIQAKESLSNELILRLEGTTYHLTWFYVGVNGTIMPDIIIPYNDFPGVCRALIVAPIYVCDIYPLFP